MAQFLLLLHDEPAKWQTKSPDEMQKAIEKYIAWGQRARQGGFYKGSEKLVDDAGKVLRGAGGKPRVTDGPYSEAKEVLGGYYLIEAKDYEQAVQRSLDHPHLEYGGTIELRVVDEVVPH
jgi:hypothetical protein